MSDRSTDGTFASWLIVGIGLALIALAGYAIFSSKGYQYAYQQNEAENAAYVERENYFRACFRLPSVEQARKCAENAPEASRAEKRAEEDLNAQREMADWAEGVLWSTLLSVAVTAVGIVFVWRTLNANTAAVEQASRANDIAERNAYADRRAWLNFNAEPTGVWKYGNRGISGAVKVTVKNFGKEPAFNCRVLCEGVIDTVYDNENYSNLRRRAVERITGRYWACFKFLMPDQERTATVAFREKVRRDGCLMPRIIVMVAYTSHSSRDNSFTYIVYDVAAVFQDGTLGHTIDAMPKDERGFSVVFRDASGEGAT